MRQSTVHHQVSFVDVTLTISIGHLKLSISIHTLPFGIVNVPAVVSTTVVQHSGFIMPIALNGIANDKSFAYQLAIAASHTPHSQGVSLPLAVYKLLSYSVS